MESNASIFDILNNEFTTTISELDFVDSNNGNYRIGASSTAKDTGKDVSAYGVNYDLDHGFRPVDIYDIGAYEYGAVVFQRPIANAGSNQNIALPANSVNLNASASTDTDGTIVSYLWEQISGANSATFQNPTSAQAIASGLIAGNYTFRLTVTDDDGFIDTDEVFIAVAPAADPPIVTSSLVSNANRNQIQHVCDQALSEAVTIAYDTFSAIGSITGSNVATGIVISGTNFTVIYEHAFQYGEAISETYAKSPTFNFNMKDLNDEEMADYTIADVTNVIYAPAVISNTTGKKRSMILGLTGKF